MPVSKLSGATSAYYEALKTSKSGVVRSEGSAASARLSGATARYYGDLRGVKPGEPSESQKSGMTGMAWLDRFVSEMDRTGVDGYGLKAFLEQNAFRSTYGSDAKTSPLPAPISALDLYA